MAKPFGLAVIVNLKPSFSFEATFDGMSLAVPSSDKLAAKRPNCDWYWRLTRIPCRAQLPLLHARREHPLIFPNEPENSLLSTLAPATRPCTKRTQCRTGLLVYQTNPTTNEKRRAANA